MSDDTLPGVDTAGGQSKIEALIASLSVSVLGYSFLDNPEGFVLAVLYREVVSLVTGFAAETGAIIADIWSIFEDTVVGGAGRALGRAASGIATPILDLIDLATTLPKELAAVAGPFGIIVAPAVWAALGVVLVVLLFGAWRLYKWFRTVIV